MVGLGSSAGRAPLLSPSIGLSVGGGVLVGRARCGLELISACAASCHLVTHDVVELLVIEPLLQLGIHAPNIFRFDQVLGCDSLDVGALACELTCRRSSGLFLSLV